jgi:hypothetical protein
LCIGSNELFWEAKLGEGELDRGSLEVQIVIINPAVKSTFTLYKEDIS